MSLVIFFFDPLIKSVFFDLQKFVNLPVFLLLSISNFHPVLVRENIYMVSIYWDLFVS